MKLFREGRQGGTGQPVWRFMERFEVPCVDRPLENHFVRYRIVQTPWFGLYVHRFDSPDVRDFHDHPWNFVSVILRGGYVEATGRPGTTARARRLRVGSFNLKRATAPHYIHHLLRTPTWTLILVGRRQRVWGYVDEHGWTRFDEHENARKFDAAVAARRS